MPDTEHYPKESREVLNAKDIKWAQKQDWSPDCVEKDGRYYLAFPACEKMVCSELVWLSATNPVVHLHPRIIV